MSRPLMKKDTAGNIRPGDRVWRINTGWTPVTRVQPYRGPLARMWPQGATVLHFKGQNRGSIYGDGDTVWRTLRPRVRVIEICVRVTEVRS